MKKQRVFWLLPLLVMVLKSTRAQVTKSYFVKGGKLTLRPTITVHITSILWKHRGDLLAEWIDNNVDLTYYGDYNNRTTLDLKTGQLEISKMDETKDSGAYTLEINNKVHGESYDAVQITEVPKPEVWITPLTCNGQLHSCNLSCDGKTAEARPITYTWKKDDKVWAVTEKMVEILKTDTRDVRTFSCGMKNPVSEKESEPKENPFFDESSSDSSVGGAVAGVLVTLIIVAAGVGLGFWQKDRLIGMFSPSHSGNAADSASASKPENGTEPTTQGLMDKEEDGKTDATDPV